jgi:hypothetical protein
MERLVLLLSVLLVCLAASGPQEPVSGLCMISSSHSKTQNTDTADVVLRSRDCDSDKDGNCDTSENSNIAWNRWTGVSPEALQQEGAHLDSHLNGEAGDLHCSGTVHDGVLAGRYEFTPDPVFLHKMESLGFDAITPRKQQGFLLLDITSDWTQQMKAAGVTDLTTGKLMGLRALHIDLAYIHALAAAGYPELSANKLTEMKAVGVTPEKIEEAKSLGFRPSEQELIQMCIFKIDRPFIERMKARGFHDLSLDKLIQVKIFKLEE